MGWLEIAISENTNFKHCPVILIESITYSSCIMIAVNWFYFNVTEIMSFGLINLLTWLFLINWYS